MPEKPKGKGVTVSVSASNFVPKPFTPFQWEPQATPEELKEKQAVLLHACPSKKINISFHDLQTSSLEGVFARGDRRLADVIETAWKNGCVFDSWNDHFRYDVWMDSFSACGLDPAFYANRRREYSETLPWDHLDFGVSKGYLERENEKAKRAETTANCRIQCAGCGASKLNGGHCDV